MELSSSGLIGGVYSEITTRLICEINKSIINHGKKNADLNDQIND